MKREKKEWEREINKWQQNTKATTKQSFHLTKLWRSAGEYTEQNSRNSELCHTHTLIHTHSATETQTGAWEYNAHACIAIHKQTKKKALAPTLPLHNNNNNNNDNISSYRHQCVTSAHENFAEADITTQRNWPARPTTTTTTVVRLNYAHTQTHTHTYYYNGNYDALRFGYCR